MFYLHILLGISVEKSAPVTIRFKCPVCTARNVAGLAQDHTERYKLLHLIPVGTVHYTWVTCSACRSLARSEIPAAELPRYAPGEIDRFIRRRLTPVLVVLLVVSIPTVLLPALGLIFSVPALAMGWKFGGWVRKLALTCVILCSLLGLAVLAASFLPDTPPAKPTFPPHKTAPAKP